MAKSKWFEETEPRIEKAKKKAEQYNSAKQIIKEAEEAITKYEMVRADADTVRSEAERIVNYIKQEIGSANEDAAKGAEAYREQLKSKEGRKKAAAAATPGDMTTDVPPYVTEQPNKAAEPKRAAKERSLTEIADSATKGIEKPAEVPAEKPVYTREMLDKAKVAAANVKTYTDKIIKAQQEEAAKEEVCALEKSAMIRTYLNEHKNDADAQEALNAAQAAFNSGDFKGVIAAYNGFDAKVKQKDNDYQEYNELETKIYRKLTTLNEIEAKIPQHEGKDYKIDNPEVSLDEVKQRVEDAKQRYKEEDYYSFGAEVNEAVEALEKLEKYAEKAAKAEPPAEEPAIETAENYEHFEAYVEDLVEDGKKKGIPKDASVSWAYTASGRGDYKAAFGYLERAQEFYEGKLAEMKPEELPEKQPEDIVAPETAEQEAARKKAEEKAEEKRHIVDVAENGEPDHVIYRTDKRSFAEAAITALKKQKINAKLKIDPDQRDSFTVMVPEELAKDKRFKPIEKELNKKTGKMHGLEKEEYDVIMKAEGCMPKQILDQLIAENEIEPPSSMLTHYKLKNAPEAVTKYLKLEARMMKLGAKPDEAEGAGAVSDEVREELYETTDIKFLEGMERAQRDGLDTGEARDLREKAKELFKKGDYRSAVPLLMSAKKKLDDEIKRGILDKLEGGGAPKGKGDEPEEKGPEPKAPETKTEEKEPEEKPEEPKDPETKPEEPKKAATTKVSVPTEVYKWASAHPDGKLAGNIVENAVKGKVYGYNLKVDAGDVASVKAGIKEIETEINIEKRQEKDIKKMRKMTFIEMNLGGELSEESVPRPGQSDHTEEKGPEENGEEESEKEEEAPVPKSEEVKKPRIAKIRCPKCKEIMEISSPRRPLEIRCSSCNAKLLMKK